MKLYNFDFSKKICFHPERIVDLKNGKRPFPITVEVDLSNICNHKCSFCFYKEHREKNKDMIKIDIIKQALKDMYNLGTRGISFSGGGEPMLHPQFLDILMYAKSIGYDCGLITNGSMIDNNNAKVLLKNLQWIRISMGGGDDITYNKIQGVNQYNKIISNIKYLCNIKKMIGSNINIGVRILVNEENIDSLLFLSNNLVKNDVYINYLQLAPDMFVKDDVFWNDNETQKKFNNVEEVLNQANIMLLTTAYNLYNSKNDKANVCYAHYFHIVITAEGDVTFCKNCRDDYRFHIGNIYKHSILDIWNSDENIGLEKEINPQCCNLICKDMAINNSIQEILNPDDNMSHNFIG